MSTKPFQTQEQVIERFKAAHNSAYDYSKMEYNGCGKKVLIICPKHGEFWQRPSTHYRGAGCFKCGKVSMAQTQRGGLETYITRLYKVQPKEFVDNFDFSQVEFLDQHTTIKNIKCKRSNHFFNAHPSQLPNGLCCLVCSDAARIKKYSEKFLRDAIKIHGNKYSYEKSTYINSYTPITIICKYHGEFKQKPITHTANRGCPSCKSSKGEAKIAMFLKQYNIEHVFQHKIRIDNSFHWFDFYIPNRKLIIEYNGMQHYKLTPFWGKGGSKEALKKQKERDKIKTQWCNANDINLLVIPYTKYDKIDDILNKNLLSDKQSLVPKS
jgi:hypothetical protein